MLANVLAPRLARLNIFYGWVVVAVTFVTMLITAGAIGLPGALILALHKDFGWDVGEISSALALRLALFWLIGPFAAALIDRYGVRNIVLTAVSLLVIGLLSALVMTDLWQLIVMWGGGGRGRNRAHRGRIGRHRIEPLVY